MKDILKIYRYLNYLKDKFYLYKNDSALIDIKSQIHLNGYFELEIHTIEYIEEKKKYKYLYEIYKVSEIQKLGLHKRGRLEEYNSFRIKLNKKELIDSAESIIEKNKFEKEYLGSISLLGKSMYPPEQQSYKKRNVVIDEQKVYKING